MQVQIPGEKINEQIDICAEIRRTFESAGRCPLALVDTYGCQQNEADSQIIRGLLALCGYEMTEDEDAADLVIINTCAVREHAEMRVLGNIGALTHTKRRNPEQIIALCGCMVQQEHMVEKIRRSYRHVDLVFGTHAVWRLPELLLRILSERGRVFDIDGSGAVAEGLPQHRSGSVKAWLSVMYGCNNFCSYCVVPYVRGRERSREPDRILDEARELIDSGYRDITLLGQNVNSYGKDLANVHSFARLISEISELSGDFRLRFMTSHPKDATDELFEAMARSPKIAKHLHLPLQSGSDRVLGAMNRGYGISEYGALIKRARQLMPELVITSDIIVGFPGETEEEFQQTLDAVRDIGYDALFTFIYSKREGTPAARIPDVISREQKQLRFDALLSLQNGISEAKHAAYIGTVQRVLIDGEIGDSRYNLSSRTDGGRLVHLRGDPALVGQFADAKISESRTWALFGEII